jgi:hypothetical protein
MTPQQPSPYLNPCNCCRIVDECSDAYDDDEYPPCHSAIRQEPGQQKDPCKSCQYEKQACAYILDGKKFEDACMSKRIQLKPHVGQQEYRITEKQISSATLLILKRIGEQPEFKKDYESLLNAERNYLCGDIYNIIQSNCSRPVHEQQDSNLNEQKIRQDERTSVISEIEHKLIESCSENYEPSGMGCKCCPFLIVYDEGLECVIKSLRKGDKP